MENLNEAIMAAVRAIGGAKVVGPMLWPEKQPEAAQRLLLDCLNPDRPAHLTPEQFALVLRKARQAGHHEAAEWLMDQLGYTKPTPREPRDEVAELQRQFVAAAATLQSMATRMQLLQIELASTKGQP